MNLAPASPYERSYQILASVAHERSRVYAWLALSFFPPDVELISSLASGRLAGEIVEACRWLGADRVWMEASITRIQIDCPTHLSKLTEDYNRLFGKSAQRVMPRETSYRWRDISVLSTSSDDLSRLLRQEYNQFGVSPTTGMEDHVAVELEFLSFLCEREDFFWQQEQPKTARELRKQQYAFLNDHLGRWYPEFCWAILQTAPDSLYAHFAQLGDDWLRLDHGPGYVPVKG